MRIDFLSGSFGYRLQHSTGKHQLLARAVGLNKKSDLKILDTTAGLGHDMFVMAKLGAQITALERNQSLYLLLQEALQTAQTKYPAVVANITLLHADAISFLANTTEKYNVIYLDPMYPERNKSALGKQEMRLLRELVGDDEDSTELLSAALQAKPNRVVVKRAKLAPLLGQEKPDLQFKGNSSRWDVYLKY